MLTSCRQCKRMRLGNVLIWVSICILASLIYIYISTYHMFTLYKILILLFTTLLLCIMSACVDAFRAFRIFYIFCCLLHRSVIWSNLYVSEHSSRRPNNAQITSFLLSRLLWQNLRDGWEWLRERIIRRINTSN